MSKTAIVKSGERFFIKQLSESQPIKLDRVIFANIPGVNSNTEIDINGTMPDLAQIVHTAPVTQSGLLNDRTVVYSVILDTNAGDFSFNYMGLVNAETNTLCMVMHTDLTKKIKTAGQCQGNTITESIWLEIDNASESTGITVNAETWQIDYSRRLAGEDERIRLTNYDLYNRLAIHDGFTITKNNNQLTISAGLAYVAGLRVNHTAQTSIKVENNQSLYIDAWLSGTVTGEWLVNHNLIAGTNLRDYEKNGFKHYVERVASVDANGKLVVVKPKSFITTYDYATTEKTGIVKLSSEINSTSETEAATPFAVKKANDNAIAAKNNANDALNIASGAVKRSGDNMTGDLYIKGLPALKFADFGAGKSKALGSSSVDNSENQFSGFLFSQSNSAGNKPFDFSHIMRSFVGDSFGDIAIDVLSKRAKFRGVLTYAGNPHYTGDYSWTEFVTAENIHNYLPVGIPMPWPQELPPDGWFECNGSKFNVNQSPRLAAAYPSGYLPDLRGEFIRGWDNERGADHGRGILSWQQDAIRNIYAEFMTAADPIFASGAFYTEARPNARIKSSTLGGNQTLIFDASRVVPVSHDNHPRNVAFMYIVKAE